MPKHGHYSNILERLTPKTKDVHPVWRGIGFSLIILIPLFSIFAAITLVKANIDNKWVIIPVDLLVNYIDPYILVKAILAFLIGFFFFAILTLITFLANRFWGPPRYGPYDVPAEEFRARKK